MEDELFMPWPAILATLTLALISAWLVFMRAWEPGQALLVVAFVAGGIVFALIATLMVFAGRENRAEVWRSIWQTFRDDLNQLLKYFGIRKR